MRTLVLGIGSPLLGDDGVFAVETQEITEITQEMTKKVKEAVPKIMSLILGEVDPISSKVSSDTKTLHLFLT